MIAMPANLAAFLAGTTANAAQVVQYLQPDPTTGGKRRLLRELTPMMGPAVQVARDQMIEQQLERPVVATEYDVFATEWAKAEFSKWLDSDVQRTFDTCTTRLDSESASEHAYRISLCRRLMAGEAITGISIFQASGASSTLVRHLANCIHLAQMWKANGNLTILKKNPDAKSFMLTLRALVALDGWIA